MKEKASGKQMSINLIASIIAFGVNVGINFFLTPFLVKELGEEAYGFIGLANNFVQYATIITAALNSISGRFISIEYHKGRKEKAESYFNSVLVANLTIAAVMLALSALFTLFLDSIINVPEHLISSVKITFALTFLTYIVSVVTAIFTTAAFVKNRVDINSVRDIISNLIKVAAVVGLFALFPAKLYFLALATLCSGMFLLLANITVKKKILPEIEINIRKFSFKLVKVILASGIWMSFSMLCNALMTGLDLLICNLTLGAGMMGILSIAKTVPVCIGNLITTLGNVFTPHYTILYAKKNINGLVSEVKFTSKLVSLIMTVPLAGFMALGRQFYTLWQPTKGPDEIIMIQILSVLTCLMFIFSCHTQCLMMLYTVCNKLKMPVFVNLGIGIVSTVSVILVLNFGNLGNNGVYVIAGVSSLLMSIRAITFMPVYSAYILKRKWTTFYGPIVRGWLCFAVVFAAFILSAMLININSWVKLIAVCAVVGGLCYVISIPVLFSRSEFKRLSAKLVKKFKKS